MRRNTAIAIALFVLSLAPVLQGQFRLGRDFYIHCKGATQIEFSHGVKVPANQWCFWPTEDVMLIMSQDIDGNQTTNWLGAVGHSNFKLDTHFEIDGVEARLRIDRRQHHGPDGWSEYWTTLVRPEDESP